MSEEQEMILAITDGPIVSENITIDQHYRFTKRIEELEAELGKQDAEIIVLKSIFEAKDGLISKLEKENAKMRQCLEKIVAIPDWRNDAAANLSEQCLSSLGGR